VSVKFYNPAFYNILERIAFSTVPGTPCPVRLRSILSRKTSSAKEGALSGSVKNWQVLARKLAG